MEFFRLRRDGFTGALDPVSMDASCQRHGIENIYEMQEIQGLWHEMHRAFREEYERLKPPATKG